MKTKTLFFALLLSFISQIAFGNGDVKFISAFHQGFLEEIDGLPVLHVKGTAKQMGRQYGYLLAHRLVDGVELVHEIALRKMSSLPRWLVRPVQKAIGFAFWTQFSRDDRNMIRGMIEGAYERDSSIWLSKYELAFLNSLIDVAGISDQEEEASVLKKLGLDWFKTNCDSFAAWGPRTFEGKTYQTRNTDVETGMGLEHFPLVVVYKPEGSIPSVSAGFVGQVGMFTGMNAYGLGLGQIWAFSRSKKLGTPWALQMRGIFSKAASPAQAVNLMQQLGNRTYGINLVFANHSGNGLAVESTPNDLDVFTADDPREDLATYNGEPYAIRLPFAVFRADFAMSPKIRSDQYSSNGPHGDPRPAEAYILRYKGQADRLLAYEQKGIKIGVDEAMVIAKETASRDGNLQSAVYENTDRTLWVSYAQILSDGKVVQAYEGKYRMIPFAQYLPTLIKTGSGSYRIQHWEGASLSRKLTVREDGSLVELYDDGHLVDRLMVE